MPEPGFLRWTGAALACGGLLTIVINAALTPLLPHGVAFAVTAASTVYVWRQASSALAALLLLFGCTGLYLRQAGRAGRFGGVAFVAAFTGSALVLATEWTQVFDVHDLALRAPAALTAMNAAKGMSLSDAGAMIALGTFALGWIALAAATIRARVLDRRAAMLVIAGFFAIPLLHAALESVTGDIIGNAILGSGWIWLGLGVRRAD